MTDSKVNYTATFTLTQEGLDGELRSSLTFSPLLTDQEVVFGEAPDAYNIMSHLVEQFLFIAGVIDEEGDVVDQEGYDNLNLLVREAGSEKGQLN
jgi:hypothetical protein